MSYSDLVYCGLNNKFHKPNRFHIVQCQLQMENNIGLNSFKEIESVDEVILCFLPKDQKRNMTSVLST